MLTVPQVVSTIIKRSRYLSEALAKDIINVSSLALYMKPEIEQILLKKVSEASITMAIRRIKDQLPHKPSHKQIFTSPPEMIIRSNLTLISILNSETLYQACSKFFNSYSIQRRQFFTLTEGFSETSIIMSHSLRSKIQHVFKKETVILDLLHLSSITIQLPNDAVTSPGVIYFFLKSLAWEGVNIIEIVSTSFELTLVFEEKNIDKAFTILKSLFPDSPKA